jgi:hypothetical protein
MSFENRHTDELVRLAVAGGGFTLSAANRPTGDLVRIAVAASSSGARVTFTGLSNRHIDELVRMGVAGKGCVVLEG